MRLKKDEIKGIIVELITVASYITLAAAAAVIMMR